MPRVEFMPECMCADGSPQEAGVLSVTELSTTTRASFSTIAWKKKFSYYIYFKNSTNTTIYVTAGERRVRRRERGAGLKAFSFGINFLCNRDVEPDEPTRFVLLPGAEEPHRFHDREILVTIQSRTRKDDDLRPCHVYKERLDALMNLRYEIEVDDLKKEIPIDMIQGSNARASE